MKQIRFLFLALSLVAPAALAQVQDGDIDTPSDTSTTTNDMGTMTTTTTIYEQKENRDKRTVQLGADFIIPYRVDDPSGREALLVGAHAELFFMPSWALSLQGVTGVEEKGFDTEPIYITPGLSFYGISGRMVEPFGRITLPILVNSDQDVGLQGGLGFLINVGKSGLGLRYSFDVTYFFDDDRTSLNLANISAVINF